MNWGTYLWIYLNVLWPAVNSYRLPRTTLPHHYEISLDVDPNPGEYYTGRVVILGTAQQATSNVVLHAENLNITQMNFYVKDRDIYSTHEQSSNDTNFLSINLLDELHPGDDFTLDISFQGMYYDSQNGIFRDSYEDKASGQTRYLLGTQMEATHARSAFPCYDEPDHKAIFVMHITCPSAYNALSNAPVTSVKHLSPENRKQFSFKPSPLMPSYLVAFVVSQFDYMSNSDEDVEQFIYPKDFKCFVQPDQKKALNFSLDFGQRTLSILEEFTDVQYEMDKMHNVGVPSFGGAMENWGLVIYGEYALAERRNDQGEIRNKETIGEIMSHEFAHMWFGNEVTPKWWDNVWLSEGFATYFQYYATSQVQPTWKSMNKFVTRSLQDALYYDSYKFFKSMNAPAQTPREISRKFNFVSYPKAGSVIRMMEHVLGEDTFRMSLRKYLKSIPKGSTVPHYLYDAMQSSAEESKEAVLPEKATVREVMGSWADQAGYPLITITRTEEKDVFNVNQRRYYRNQELSSAELWWVPLNWVTENSLDFSSTAPQHWMSPVSNISLFIQDSTPYFILNKQQTGYYRIMYDKDNWEAINKVLDEDPQQIHELNRAQLMDDSMEFAAVGILPYNTSMRLLSYLEHETQQAPWAVAERIFKHLQVLMRNSVQYPKFEKMVQSLNAKRLRSLGFTDRKGDSSATMSNRKSAVEVACSVNSVECISRGIVSQWLSLRDTTSWGTVLCAGLRNLPVLETPARWTLLWNYFLKSRDMLLRGDLLDALACVSDSTILSRLLKYSLHEDIHTPEVSPLIERIISSTPQGSQITLDFMLTHLQIIKKRLRGKNGMSDIFETLGQHITSDTEIAKMETLLKRWSKQLSGKETDDILVALEVARHNVKWLKEIRPDLDQWLKHNIH